MNVESTDARLAHNSPSDNVLKLRENVDIRDDVATNVVAIHRGPVLNVLEPAVDDAAVEIAYETAAEAVAACMNGVCSINWKPKRPTAA